MDEWLQSDRRKNCNGLWSNVRLIDIISSHGSVFVRQLLALALIITVVDVSNGAPAAKGENNLRWHNLILNADDAPVVTNTIPERGATLKVNAEIIVDFSQEMDTASVRNAFTLRKRLSVNPDVSGSFYWAKNRTRIIFVPHKDLDPLSGYALTISGDAQGISGRQLDGNGDGYGGDQFALNFTSGVADAVPPKVVATYPAPDAVDVPLLPVISITYNEILDEESIANFRFYLYAHDDESISFAHYIVNDRSVLNVYPANRLAPNQYYRFEVVQGLRDVAGNEIDERYDLDFRTSGLAFAITKIEDFESRITDYWLQPNNQYMSEGIFIDSTTMRVDPLFVNRLSRSTQSMRIDYGWKVRTGHWFIREYNNGGPPGLVTFSASDLLQVYIFGDGLGNRFRFAVDELSTSEEEVSPWFVVDWIGWRLVSWDIDKSAGLWGDHGNGVISGPLRFDSFQFTYTNGMERFGTYYLDDLRAVQQVEPVKIAINTPLPQQFDLAQNFPNPFGASTTLQFDVPTPELITITIFDLTGKVIAVLTDNERYARGIHEITWEASNLPSGVYFARMQAGEALRTIKLVHVK